MGTEVKRGAGVTMAVVLVAAVGALGYGVAQATATIDTSPRSAAPSTPAVQPSSQSAPKPAPQQEQPINEPVAPAPKPPILEPGDHGPQVRELQARLRQIAWYAGKVTDTYGAATTAAVRGFQTKRGLPALGYVDKATLKRLREMTRRPTTAELANAVGTFSASDGTWTDAPLDARCLTGRVMCIDKASRTIRWVVDGEVRKTMAVRFGSSYTPTREGLFHVQSKSRNHVSSLFDSSMPFAMFFSRGQAVHFSSDFAARGYNGASHGCVNVRDYEGVKALFDEVRVGDKVVVYWS